MVWDKWLSDFNKQQQCDQRPVEYFRELIELNFPTRDD